MSILEFSFQDVVDSTSSLASRMIKDGHALPFAVGASQQSAGRGRMGRDWQSPEGNIYLTVALPGSDIPLHDVTKAPLLVGYIAAKWVESRFGFRPTLKWPNDILCRGRKLGGILCESIVVGDKLKSVLVGIGVNLKNSNSVPPFAISVEGFLGSKVSDSPKEYCASLSEAIVKGWSPSHLANAVPLFKQYGLPDGALWVERNGRSGLGNFVQKGITNGGALLLEDHKGEVREVISVDHNYGWAHLVEMRNSLPVYVGDIGNSRVKIAAFGAARGNDPDKTWSIGYGGEGEILRFAEDDGGRQGRGWRQGHSDANADDHDHDYDRREERVSVACAAAEIAGRQGAGYPVYFLSVQPQRFLEIEKVFAAHGLRAVHLPKRGVAISYPRYEMGQLGADRVGLMEGVVSKYQRRSFLAVSCGTAVTVDVVIEGSHLGGFILAGMQTKLDALAERTGLLPQFQLDAPRGDALNSLPGSTKEAMVRGAVFETAAFIKSVRTDQEALRNQPLAVFITGGDSPQIAAHISGAITDEYLVLEGCRSIALGGV